MDLDPNPDPRIYTDPDSDPDPAIYIIDQQKTEPKKFFCILLFEGTSFFKDNKSKRSHKTVGIKGFLTSFA